MRRAFVALNCVEVVATQRNGKANSKVFEPFRVCVSFLYLCTDVCTEHKLAHLFTTWTWCTIHLKNRLELDRSLWIHFVQHPIIIFICIVRSFIRVGVHLLSCSNHFAACNAAFLIQFISMLHPTPCIAHTPAIFSVVRCEEVAPQIYNFLRIIRIWWTMTKCSQYTIVHIMTMRYTKCEILVGISRQHCN